MKAQKTPPDVEVFALGALVTLLHPKLDAVITAVNIREEGTTYEVVWWDGKARKCEWVTAAEIDAGDDERRRIGFRK